MSLLESSDFASSLAVARLPAISEDSIEIPKLVNTNRPVPVFCDWVQMAFPVESVPHHFDRWVTCGTRRGVVDWRRPAWTQLRDARAVQCWQVDTGERDENGEAVYRREYIEQCSSDSTKVQVRHLPLEGLLKVSGNLGRWGKRDNVFGVGVWRAAMGFLDHLAKYDRVTPQADPRLQRIDLTANVSFTSSQDAYDWLSWAASVKLGRAMPKRYDTGCTWVTENWSAKVYDKLADLKRHGHTALADTLQADLGYLLRFEVTLRTDELARYGMGQLSDWFGKRGDDMGQVIFSERFGPLINGAGGVSVDDAVRSLPLRLATALDSWRHGTNYPAAVADGRMNRRTYYRLRKELKEAVGIDIALPCSVTALRIVPREIQPSFVEAPAWYREAA